MCQDVMLHHSNEQSEYEYHTSAWKSRVHLQLTSSHNASTLNYVAVGNVHLHSEESSSRQSRDSNGVGVNVVCSLTDKRRREGERICTGNVLISATSMPLLHLRLL